MNPSHKVDLANFALTDDQRMIEAARRCLELRPMVTQKTAYVRNFRRDANGHTAGHIVYHTLCRQRDTGQPNGI